MVNQTLGRGVTTAAETFWYYLGCLWFGAYYFAKIPTKKALSEYGLTTMSGAEWFWYVMMNIALGAGYFSKVITKKALSEVRFGGGGWQAAFPAWGADPPAVSGPVGPNAGAWPPVEGTTSKERRPGTDG
ncbi:hypothetical protein ACWC09_51875 [Streptomyces sp. NPDC001617]